MLLIHSLHLFFCSVIFHSFSSWLSLFWTWIRSDISVCTALHSNTHSRQRKSHTWGNRITRWSQSLFIESSREHVLFSLLHSFCHTVSIRSLTCVRTLSNTSNPLTPPWIQDFLTKFLLKPFPHAFRLIATDVYLSIRRLRRWCFWSSSQTSCPL